VNDKTWEDWHDQFEDDMRDYERATTVDGRNVALMCAESALENLQCAINNLISEETP